MTPAADQPRPAKAPLWAVLAITFILSIGTGAVTQGLYFIADASCDFSRSASFLLGVVLGACYIPGALAAGPVLRRLEARAASLTPRSILLGITVTAGAVSLLPPIVLAVHRDPTAAVWIVGAVYGLTTGFMWPLVEWYLAGGRKQQPLRAATGRFNITWTTAVVAAFWVLSPFLSAEGASTDPARALAALYLVAALHAVAIPFILALPRTPARHLDIHHEPHSPIYHTLLRASRRLLPASYLLMCVLGPAFPVALTAMGIDRAWQPILVSVWLIARVASMLLLERWHGWHGRAWPLAIGAAALFLGFAGAAAAPPLGSLPMLILSLATFGVGMGTVYTSALYYALEIGDHGADAGGSHEALIGVGYTVGPLIGLAISTAIDAGALEERAFAPALIASAILFTGLGLVMSVRSKRCKPIN
ncbi:MAG: MFS transporter [Phycisphaerales bacterium]